MIVSLQEEPNLFRWRLNLNSPTTRVLQALSTGAGRASFWAESAVEINRIIHFVFPNQMAWDGLILESNPPQKFSVRYYGNSTTTFRLEKDDETGTILTLIDAGVPL